ncbi:hypothetical protein CTEN210_15964 [Chaetoceros tenuissimus]|uniref:RING-type domain-containing protein n=1 Tax=Chaetoceros tenuissimus TaxID=426638 RepID=A0AAD3D850_9STRA|nr:hypothetical protein CTEN210_15964 [Chaetoceros tenuissimus]
MNYRLTSEIDITIDYPNCVVENPSKLGDGTCNNYGGYNTEECNWDGGDCVIESYPDCHVDNPFMLGDGRCDGNKPKYNTVECGWDDGDCLKYNKYPNCTHDYNPYIFGDDVCHSQFNSEECGWDDGDCVAFNSKYPNCKVDYPMRIGNGLCDSTFYPDVNTTECGYDGGDCLDPPTKWRKDDSSKGLVSSVIMVVISIILFVFFYWDIWRKQTRDDTSAQQNFNDTQLPDRHTLVLTSIIHKKVCSKNIANGCGKTFLPHESILSQRSTRFLASIAEEGMMSKDNIMVNTSVRDVSIEENFSEKNNLKICPICCEEYKKGDDIAWSKNEKCTHAFHMDCIVPWLTEHNDCPMCRNDYLCLGQFS